MTDPRDTGTFDLVEWIASQKVRNAENLRRTQDAHRALLKSLRAIAKDVHADCAGYRGVEARGDLSRLLDAIRQCEDQMRDLEAAIREAR